MKRLVKSLLITLTIFTFNPIVVVASTETGTRILCADEADCRSKWQRAEKWVRKHSYWPMQTVSETVIATQRQRARNYSRLYYRITKEKQNGQTIIQFHAGCLPSVSCSPEPSQAFVEFKRFVMGSQ